MASFTPTERKQLEDLLGMASGYVLDFSNRSLAEFVKDSVKKEIDADIYMYGSSSKANRLRKFWEVEPDSVVGQLLKDLVEYAEFKGNDLDPKLLDAARKTVARLVGTKGNNENAVCSSEMSERSQKENGPPVMVVDGIKTLPLYSVKARLLEKLNPLSKARAEIVYENPDYFPPPYDASPEGLSRADSNPEFAKNAVRDWRPHVSAFATYIQFKVDAEAEYRHAIYRHTELLSVLCDSRLSLDPTCLWHQYDGYLSVAFLQEEYREDPNRDEKWDTYAERLAEIRAKQIDPTASQAMRLIERMQKKIELTAGRWQTFPPLQSVASDSAPRSQRTLFYSYSHVDEAYRDELEKQLVMLRRQGLIAQWHDRKITAGKEWKGQISKHLENADIVLLLLSSDFLSSEYCYDVEADRAMQRYREGSVLVIPVFLRACEWNETPFAQLQALPKDGRHIKSWPDPDEAFVNVAQGIRAAISERWGQSTNG